MTQKTIDSIRRLAERPGTEHEGIVAKEMLRKLSGNSPSDEETYLSSFRSLLRREITLEEFIRRHRDHPEETLWQCPCGDTITVNGKCLNQIRHADVQREIREMFKPGDRVFYNYWAYPLNCAGNVNSYIRDKPENSTHPWAWISVKFEHLKMARQVPILSVKGWHLTHEPLSVKDGEKLSSP